MDSDKKDNKKDDKKDDESGWELSPGKKKKVKLIISSSKDGDGRFVVGFPENEDTLREYKIKVVKVPPTKNMPLVISGISCLFVGLLLGYFIFIERSSDVGGNTILIKRQRLEAIIYPFGLGKGDIDFSLYEEKFRNLRETLISNSNCKLIINGYADDLPLRPGGRFRTNIELSAARAESVKNYFIEKGIPRDRLIAQGFGTMETLARTHPEGQPLNRRVVLIFEEENVSRKGE